MKIETQPYYFLDRSVHLLIVDSDQKTVRMLLDGLQPARLYSAQTANTARKAQPVLEGTERQHVCIMELGIADIRGDEFFLMKKFQRHVSFVVLTGAASPAKGFMARQLGAKALAEKSGDFDFGKFFSAVSRNALLAIVNPRYREDGKDPLTHSTDVLFEKSPETVTQWAIEMGVTDRELRYIWTKALGANTKIILFIYQVYRKAIAYYQNLLAHPRSQSWQAEADEGTKGSDEYRRHEEYYHLHRSVICDYLAYGNVVNFVQEPAPDLK
jgi:ActR/RegA family two-component response regulator